MTMRQQHDEVNAIQSQVESLQLQVALVPMEIEADPSTTGSSPSFEQPLLDLNFSAQDNEMDDQDPPNHLSPGN